MASAPARGQARNKPRSSAVIALLLLARELLGHRLGRKLRGPGTLSPDPRECSSVHRRLEPAHARARVLRGEDWTRDAGEIGIG